VSPPETFRELFKDIGDEMPAECKNLPAELLEGDQFHLRFDAPLVTLSAPGAP
jgi:hypothetical protein